jgi:hypothetical protein
MELVAVVLVLVLSSVMAGAAARGLMALTFFLLLRSTAADEINTQVPSPGSQGTGLAASA